MENSNGWTKYVNVFGFLGLLTAIIYVNPVANVVPAILAPYQFLHDRVLQAKPNNPFDDLPPEYRNGCPAHKFKSVRHLSRAPDVILIEGFLTPFEADYLIKVA